MFIDVTLTAPPSPPILCDADNFKAFKVVVHGDGDLAGALAGLGRVENGDAFVDASAVKQLAGARGSDPAWVESFDAMVEYARSKGWVAADGAVQAHCERAA